MSDLEEKAEMAVVEKESGFRKLPKDEIKEYIEKLKKKEEF